MLGETQSQFSLIRTALITWCRPKTNLFICLALALATLAVYCQIGRFEFTNYDDSFMIVNNAMVNRGLTVEGLLWALTTFFFASWHPLTWLSLMLDCQLFGLRAGYHHLANLAFHTANALLVFQLLWRMTGSRWRSAFVAAFFALHPLRAESVAWAAERKDVLCGLFFLLTLWAYSRYVESSKAQPSRPWLWYGVSLACFALGLMSKPMLVTLPFVMLLLDYWPLQRLEPRDLHRLFGVVREKLPFFALSVASSFVTYVSSKNAGALFTGTEVPWGLRLTNVPVSYALYLIKTVWPADLAVLYPMPSRWGFWPVAGSLILLGAITAGVLLRGRRMPYLVFGWFTFLGVLVPTIGLVSFGVNQSIADRFTYLPSIGLFVAVVWALADWSQRWDLGAPLAGVAALALVLCGFMTWRQVGYWQNSLTLWNHCVAVTGDKNITGVFERGYSLQLAGREDEALNDYRKVLQLGLEHPHSMRNEYYCANLNLGAILLGRGRPGEATNYLYQALEIRPEEPEPHAKLGFAFRELGDYSGALTQCTEAIRLDPGKFEPFFDIARTFSALGRSPEALDYFSETLRRNTNSPHAYFYYGLELLSAGQLEAAATNLHEAVRLRPAWPETHLEYGVALDAQGDLAQAVGEYREALRLKPSLIEALNNLAWILATCTDAQLRNGPEAVRLAERACEETSWKQTIFIGTLSAAYAEAGQFEKAVATSQRACALALSLGQTNLLAYNQQLLAQFGHHEPYRHQTAVKP